MEHLREKVAKPINHGELLAQRQAELAALQFATDLRGQSFGAFENHALSGNTFNVQPQFSIACSSLAVR